MGTTSDDSIADMMTALAIYSTVINDDPRLPQALTEFFASIDAGDHENAAHVVREFLHSIVSSTLAEAQPDLLADAIQTLDDAVRILVEQFAQGHADLLPDTTIARVQAGHRAVPHSSTDKPGPAWTTPRPRS